MEWAEGGICMLTAINIKLKKENTSWKRQLKQNVAADLELCNLRTRWNHLLAVRPCSETSSPLIPRWIINLPRCCSACCHLLSYSCSLFTHSWYKKSFSSPQLHKHTSSWGRFALVGHLFCRQKRCKLLCFRVWIWKWFCLPEQTVNDHL